MLSAAGATTLAKTLGSGTIIAELTDKEESPMKLMMTALLAGTIGAASLGAQATKTETKSKVVVKGGKEVRVTGCVETNGSGFMLSNVADKTGPLKRYMLVSHDSELSKHVGHRVQIAGKASDKGDGKIETETKTKTTVEHGKDREASGKFEEHGDLADTAYLRVDSVKMIAASCP
jgi:hypothetical protein